MSQSPIERIKQLDASQAEEANAELSKCCKSMWWVEQMLAARPFGNADGLHRAADTAFDQMPREAWLEAFASHPQIGDLESLKMKFAGNKRWSAGEQASIAVASEAVLVRLREGNQQFYKKFGFVFLVCATGKSAADMLAILERRLQNDPVTEFCEATDEQRKITHLRLDKLLTTNHEG